MKKLFFVALMAAVAFTSCKIEDGYKPRRTVRGLSMYSYVDDRLQVVIKDVQMFYRADAWLSATTDEERNKIHDAYFYYNYLGYDADKRQLLIRFAHDELIIETNGKLLHEVGSKWSYYYLYRGGKGFVPLTMECTAEGKYSVEYLQSEYNDMKRLLGEHHLTMEMSPVGDSLSEEYELVFNGTGRCSANLYLDEPFRIEYKTNELKWNNVHSMWYSGTIDMTTDNGGTDTARATLDYDSVEIEYRGLTDRYSTIDY